MRKFRNTKGFTLIELMIVVVIIGILAALAIPRFSQVSRNSKQAEAESILKQIHTLQEAHFERFNQYATTLTPGATATATVLGGWDNPNAKFYTFTISSGTATAYCASSALTTEGTAAGLQNATIRVTDRTAATPTATDGKPQFATTC